MSLFADRRYAGRVVAAALVQYAGRDDVMVLALPRGGVPVGYEVAHALRAPLDVFVVRKLGAPGYEELAMGAIASGGVCVLNQDVVARLHVSKAELFRVARAEQRELARRERAYRIGRPPVDVSRKIVVLVDDGLATGSTLRAALQAVRQLNPLKVVAAVPVASLGACAEMSEEADEMVCAATPQPFRAVGSWYEDFSQTTDDEVRQLLESARAERQQDEEPGRHPEGRSDVRT
jgi:putative phosphoribosyl transferase